MKREKICLILTAVIVFVVIISVIIITNKPGGDDKVKEAVTGANRRPPNW